MDPSREEIHRAICHSGLKAPHSLLNTSTSQKGSMYKSAEYDGEQNFWLISHFNASAYLLLWLRVAYYKPGQGKALLARNLLSD